MIKIRVAIVGAGNISNTRHIPALKKTKGVEIVGVLSNKRSKAERTAAAHNIPKIAILGVEGLSGVEWIDEVDAVVIGAPPHEHYSLVKLFLENNKHVLVEKPMTMTVLESRELIAMAKKAT